MQYVLQSIGVIMISIYILSHYALCVVIAVITHYYIVPICITYGYCCHNDINIHCHMMYVLLLLSSCIVPLCSMHCCQCYSHNVHGRCVSLYAGSDQRQQPVQEHRRDIWYIARGHVVVCHRLAHAMLDSTWVTCILRTAP